MPIFEPMTHHPNHSPPRAIHSLRVVASCALLGAVIMGVLTGWTDQQAVDFRLFGAIAGGMVAGAAMLFNLI